ncbi:MAG: MBL fold metallo-hydrolase [Phycisphaerales bacterium JB043]
MNLTRREFSILAASTAAAAHPFSRALGAFRQDEPAPSVFDWTQLIDGVHLIADHGGNAILAKTKDAIVLIDAKNAGFGPSLKRETTASLGAPDILINTHHHADHTGGNESFTSSSEIAAHHKALQRISDQTESYLETINGFESYLGAPDQDIPETALLRKDVADLLANASSLTSDDFVPTRPLHHLPGQDELANGVETIHVTSGHTDNDIAIFFPEHNVLHMGDLFFNNLHPFIRLSDGASTDGWIESLIEIYKLCDGGTIVVPGHGQVTVRDDLAKQITYIRNMKRIVGLQIDKGTPRHQILEIKPKFCRDYGFGRLREVFMGAVYDEIMAERG